MVSSGASAPASPGCCQGSINKEFTAFFHDPERKRLTGWQRLIFSAIGIVVGFVLGAILITAVSG